MHPDTLGAAALWLPDLFGLLWETLEAHTNRIVSECWDTKDYGDAETRLMQALRSARGAEAPMGLMVYLQSGDSSEQVERYFLAARCIDDALAALHPGQTLRVHPPALASIHDHYLSEGRYNRTGPGWVLPRGPLSPFAKPPPDPAEPRRGRSGDRLDQVFRYLRCIAPPAGGRFEYRHTTVPARHDFDPDMDFTALKVAVVPWAEACDAVHFSGSVRQGKPLLDCACVEPPAGEHAQRAEALIERLDAEGVSVALLPELVVSPAATKALGEALRKRLATREGSLRLLVAGSGLREPDPEQGGRHHNACVVLAGTGRPLWTQSKLNHYAMAASAMERYDLKHCIQQAGADHMEDVATGNVVEIRQGRLGRMVVLICEDMSQAAPRDHLLDCFRPDWIFAPILDGEPEVGRWIHQKAWREADEFQTNVLIGTSLVLSRRQAPTQTRFAVGLGVSPGSARSYCRFEVDVAAPGPLFSVWVWDHALWPAATIK